MTEDPTNDTSTQPEPSMEDILASIRRILAEDGEADQDDEQDDGAGSEPQPEALPEDLETTEPEPVVAVDEMFDAEPEEAAEITLEAPDDVPEPPDDIPEPIEPIEAPMPEPRVEEPIFELTPAMKAAADHAVISRPAADSSTDVLSQLAKAILNRRDLSISASQVTLEEMVREMLRPLLKEWLDRNLPYLIERLVKREMDIMVNRAERLE